MSRPGLAEDALDGGAGQAGELGDAALAHARGVGEVHARVTFVIYLVTVCGPFVE